MEEVPLAVLQLIFESLAHNDTHDRRSVRAIALTSKYCCAAIDREHFRRVKVVFWSRPDLEVAIKRWTDTLQRDDRYRHVQSLSIFEKTEPWTEENAETYKRTFFTSTPADLHQAFTALTHFTSKCVALKDLSWESDEPIPTILLNMMSQHQPRIRLHVHPFNLKSLVQSSDELHDIGGEDYALATSPNLYSITVTEGYFISEGDINYNGDALPYWVSGMAPNLRSVDVFHEIPGNTPQLVQALRMIRPEWQGPFKGVQSSHQDAKGQLRQLTLRGSKPLSRVVLQGWSRATDFSVLTSLTLMVSIKEVAMSDLSDMAERGHFRGLKSLSMNVHGETVGPRRLIAAFPPLEFIAVFGESHELWGDMIRCHGERLRDLRLTGPLELNDLIWLTDAVPKLRSLNIAMARRNGDAEEVRCYQQIGKLSKLQQLTLRLSFKDSIEVFADYFAKRRAPSEDEIQQFRHVLANIAIDEQLAQETFRVILNASQAARPGLTPHFVQLELRSWDEDVDEGAFGNFGDLRSFMARNWLCERRYADVHSEDSWVTEIDVNARNTAREGLEYHRKEDWTRFEEEAIYEAAWMANWPQARDKDDWLDDWHSFPLWQGSE